MIMNLINNLIFVVSFIKLIKLVINYKWEPNARTAQTYPLISIWDNNDNNFESV